MKPTPSGFKELAQEYALYPQEQLQKVREGSRSLSIGIPKEVESLENRIALTPGAVGILVNNGHEISVEKEVSYLKNYVELQRLRKDENYRIEFSCSQELINFKLPPLLLLPFVENAFKHVSHFSEKKNVIKILLSKTDNLFRLNVFNTKDSSQLASENGGVGLKNVKRRLELLYKDRYLLDVVNSIENFEVNLELKIESNSTL